MKAKTPYVKHLHSILFFFFLTITTTLFAQTTYEGFGALTTGGAGQQVVHVTNLNASGAGSLKAAIASNRTIVFDVGGTISGFKFDGGNGDPNNIVNLTIDGSTAPSPGITLDNQNNGNCLGFEGTGNHNIIIKYIRTINAGNDGLHFNLGCYNIIVDHCSTWGNRDGNLDITDGAHDITVQYCILGGGAPNTASYSGTMLLGYSPVNISVHHNLFNPRSAGNVGERCPNVSDPGRNSLPNFLMADIRNNLMWKWGRNNGTGSGYATSCAYFATENCVNNYYYSTQSPTSATNMDDGYGGGSGSSKGYFAGNFSGNTGYNPNAISNTPEYAIPAAAQVTMQSPCAAAMLILANAGVRYGNVPLSAAEQAMINDVALVNCTGTNQPPVANAGNNITLTLPVNSATLTGSGTDADGTIVSYAWARVSGPTTFTLGTANAANTILSNLVQGTYVFRLTVTDNGGATGTATVTVTVNAAANQPPTSNAGSDVTLTLPVNSTTLLGSGTDADGTIVSYAWARVSGPATFTLGAANAATTALSNLVAGTYVFRLTVTDNGGATGTDNVTVTVNAVVNQLPTANAGSDITLTLPVNSTTLNGSGTDADGTIVSYAWARVSGPATFTLGTANAATTTLINLVQGVYVFRLTVTDNSGATATDNVTVTVNAAANQPPAANAGNNIILTLPANSTTLSGSGTDADGTIVSYGWTWVSGPATFTLGTANAATTTLTNLVQGVYTFRLTVTDNNGATGTDDVTVTVNAAANQPPTANAGNNIVITLPTNSTTLAGSGTDADGTIVSYGWTRVSGPATFTLANASAATTALSNLVQGVYTFRLTVTDNSGATATDDVTVTVNASSPSNQAPIAIAGNNITLNLPANTTTLNGTGSFDPDGTIAGYGWTRVSGPATFTLANANAATTGLSNLVAGTYIFQLTVTDNNGATDDDNITVIVSATANQPPTANAGNNIVLTLPLNSTNLNGGSSTDADGTIVSYGWTRVSGPATFTLVNANAAATGLSNLVQGTYVFRLTVTDNDGATATDDVTVTVNAAPNQSPTANAGSDITLTLPINSAILTGSGYDPDGTIVSYAWTWVSGPATFTLVNASAASTGLNGLVQGAYVFRLTVTDNSGATATDVVTVTVNPSNNQSPTANAGADITITLPNNTTTLYGSGSDPDGTIAGYAWSNVSGPATFTLANTSSATTGLYNLVQGVYVFRLIVTDNRGATATDVVTVTVNAVPPPAGNQPPTARTDNDIVLILPANTTQLHGNTSTDPDGVIVSYSWTQVSGPGQAVIINGLTSVATVSDLTTGIYTFELKVTDNGGAFSVKTMKVTVDNQRGQNAYINIYPNPVSGILNMQYVENTNGTFRITIYDANRRLMRDEVIDKTQVSITKTMDVSSFGSGVYFIQVTSPDNGIVVKQFVKM